MSLSNPRVLFGVHSISPYNRDSGEFYGVMKCVKGSSISLSSELVKLKAGSNRYDWAVENAGVESEMSLKFSEYPDFAFELFFGRAPTSTSGDTGTVSTPENMTGDSIFDAANGISAIGVIPTTGAANLKSGIYVLKATDTDTVDIYHSSDIQHDRGTDVTYTSDLLKVGSVEISGATNDVEDLGLRFTKTGTPAFTTGDTCRFEVDAPSSKKMEVVIGATTDVLPEFGCQVYAQRRSDGAIFSIDAYRCKAGGGGLGLEPFQFSESEVKVSLLYDAARSGVAKLKHIQP